jgi:hypothetical protein
VKQNALRRSALGILAVCVFLGSAEAETVKTSNNNSNKIPASSKKITFVKTKDKLTKAAFPVNNNLKKKIFDYLKSQGIDTKNMTIVSATKLLPGMKGAVQVKFTLRSQNGTTYEVIGTKVIYPNAQWKFSLA